MEWISVKDRLPEKQESYIVLIPNGIVTILFYNGYQWLINDRIYSFCSNEITHWMPIPFQIPEQPKEIWPSTFQSWRDNRLPVCPKCGAETWITTGTFEGAWAGWGVGCPKFCLNDGIHGCTKESKKKEWFKQSHFPSKRYAKEAWIDRVKRGEWKISPWQST